MSVMQIDLPKPTLFMTMESAYRPDCWKYTVIWSTTVLSSPANRRLSATSEMGFTIRERCDVIEATEKRLLHTALEQSKRRLCVRGPGNNFQNKKHAAMAAERIGFSAHLLLPSLYLDLRQLHDWGRRGQVGAPALFLWLCKHRHHPTEKTSARSES